MPVPDGCTFRELSEALSVMETVPLRAPGTLGVNVTFMAQAAPGVRFEPQVLFCAKLPQAEMPAILKLALPLLVT